MTEDINMNFPGCDDKLSKDLSQSCADFIPPEPIFKALEDGSFEIGNICGFIKSISLADSLVLGEIISDNKYMHGQEIQISMEKGRVAELAEALPKFVDIDPKKE